MASAAAAAAMTRAVRPTVPKAMARKATTGAVFSGGNVGFLRPSPGKKAVSMSGPKGAFKSRTPGNISPNFTGANPAQYNLNQMTTAGPARATGNAAAYGMSPEMMGATGGAGKPSWLDDNADFLTEAFNTMNSEGGPEELLQGGGGGGGGGYAGGMGTNSSKTWDYGRGGGLLHRELT